MSSQNPPPSSFASHLRHASMGPQQLSSSTGQSSALQARINEKRAELENLRQLRDLSGNLAAQMQALEEKLGTLSDGTEAVAAVLSNWHNVLRAINMASQKIPKPPGEDNGAEEESNSEPALPQTLVRISVQTGEDENP